MSGFPPREFIRENFPANKISAAKAELKNMARFPFGGRNRLFEDFMMDRFLPANVCC